MYSISYQFFNPQADTCCSKKWSITQNGVSNRNMDQQHNPNIAKPTPVTMATLQHSFLSGLACLLNQPDLVP